MSRTVSSAGLALIKKFEGFIAEPVQIGEGRWVVGHGHVREGHADAAVTAAIAEALLIKDLQPVIAFVNEHAGVKLSQSQFDVLVSFAFSIGLEAFAQSAVLRRVQAGHMLAAACAMEAWRKSDASGELEILGALVRRRAVEKAMFLKTGAEKAAPSAFLRPQMDHAVSILGAPLAYGATPALKSTEQKAALTTQVEPAKLITDILMSEPATAALLLTQVVVDDDFDDDGEIVTAHAKPVARDLVKAAAPQRTKKFWNFSMQQPVETFGLAALFAFGFGLASLSVTTLLSGQNDLIDYLGASAFAAPGALAMFMASFGFMRGPAPIRA
jgi:lysozyme